METKSRRLVRLDSSRVSGLQSCHAVGLWACDRTYGDLLSLQRLVSDTKPPLEEAELMARMGERRAWEPRRDGEATRKVAESPRRESDDNGNGMRLMVGGKSRRSGEDGAISIQEPHPRRFTPPTPPPSLLPQTCVIRGSTHLESTTTKP